MSIPVGPEGRLLDQIWKAKGGSQPVLDSYNDFINVRIPKILSGRSIPIPNRQGVYLKFSDPFFTRPSVMDLKANGTHRPLWPRECRINNTSYMADLFARASIIREESLGVIKVEDVTEVFIGSVPVMIGSVLDHLYEFTDDQAYQAGEPPKDPKGYFIISGQERLLTNIEKLRTSYPLLYEKKEGYNVSYTAQTTYESTMVKISAVKIFQTAREFSHDEIHVAFDRLGQGNTINIFYIFRILGLQPEEALAIMETFIVEDNDPTREALRKTKFRQYIEPTINTFLVQYRGVDENLYKVLLSKIVDPNILASTEPHQAAVRLVIYDLFKNIPIDIRNPHKTINEKIRLLASMVVKFGEFQTGYRSPDNRDFWGNKRITDAGEHMVTEFTVIWKDMLKDIDEKIRKKIPKISDIKNYIPTGKMRQQFERAFTRGLWGSTRAAVNKDVAVVDILKRDTRMAALAQKHRIVVPTNRKAPIIEKRLINGSQWGFACPAMTVEGEACIEKHTLIMMADGTQREVGTLRNGDKILTIDPTTFQQTTTQIYNHFVKPSTEYGKKVFKITTLTGESIVATEDHPFLTQQGWIQAGSLQSAHGLIVHCAPVPMPNQPVESVILDRSEFAARLTLLDIKPSLIEKHANDLEKRGLLPLKTTHPNLYLIARICGFVLADGSICISNGTSSSNYSFGTEYDSQLFIEDMMTLGFDQHTPSYNVNTIVDKITGRPATHHCWSTSYGACWSSLLLALGMMFGKRVEKEHLPIPEWVMNGTLLIKREFLSGFQGGDGGKVSWNKRHNKVTAGKFNFGSTIRHKDPKYTQSLVYFMEQLADLMRQFGVEIQRVITVREPPTYGPKPRDRVEINPSDKEENIIQYMTMVGYRYATTKSSESYYYSQYLKYKQSKIQERVNLKAFVLALKAQGLDQGQIARALNITPRQASSITEYNAVSQGRTLAPKDTISFEQWKLCTAQGVNCVLVPIKSIELHPDCMIADFTTISNNHTMVSNGFVTHNCGLVKEAGQSTYISLDRDASVIHSHLNDMYSLVPDPSQGRRHSLYVNGVHVGYANTPEVHAHLRNLRRTGRIYFDTGIVLDVHNDIWVTTASGRVCRPLLILDTETQELLIDKKGLRGQSIDTLLNNGVMEYIDAEEQLQPYIYIATTTVRIQEKLNRKNKTLTDYQTLAQNPDTPEDQLRSALKAVQSVERERLFTHLETDANVILGTSASTIPLPEFMQGPRSTYQAAMGKQALGADTVRTELRYDTTYKTLKNPSVPFFATEAHDRMGFDETPAGANVIMCILPYGGFNQEDAIIMSERFLQLGHFWINIHHSVSVAIKQGSDYQEKLKFPKYSPEKAARYSKIDPTTFIVRVGEMVEPGDCIVAKVMGEGENEKDTSVYLELKKKGIVESVSITNETKNKALIQIRLREQIRPQAGDKYSSRYSQKGVIGKVLPAKDMPYIVSEDPRFNGVTPHIIFSPMGIPTRMTINKLMEMVVGIYAGLSGNRVNATAFRRFTPELFYEELERLGYHNRGYERMVEGTTGRVMDANIFVGPVYYQALKHLVTGKEQARGAGKLQFLTHQPQSGIRMKGGLRFGEMEKDAFGQHGAGALLQERLMYSSDVYETFVCTECGKLAIPNADTGDLLCVKKCPGGKFGRVTIPYIKKLMGDYLSSLSLNMSMRTKPKLT